MNRNRRFTPLPESLRPSNLIAAALVCDGQRLYLAQNAPHIHLLVQRSSIWLTMSVDTLGVAYLQV